MNDMIRKPFVLLVPILGIVGCSSTMVVEELDSTKTYEGGVITYKLPDTFVDVKITLSMLKDQKPLDKAYIDAAPYIFGHSKYYSNAISCRVKSAEMSAVGRGGKTYVGFLKQEPFSNHTSSLSFEEDGVLAEASLSDSDQSFNFAVQTIGSVAGVVNSALLARVENGDKIEGMENVEPRVIATVKRIQNLTEIKSSLYRSEMNEFSKKEAEKIDGEIASLVSLFYGSRTIKTAEVIVRIDPRIISVKNGCSLVYVDKKVSEVKGENKSTCSLHINPNVALQGGAPSFLGLSNHYHPNGKKEAKAILKVKNIAHAPEIKQGGISKDKKGIHYCIPGKAQFTVWSQSKPLTGQALSIAQYGRVAFLPTNTGSKDTSLAVTLHATTGALKSVTLSGNAIDGNTLKGAEAEVGGIFNNKANRELNKLNLSNSEKEAKLKQIQLTKDLEAAGVTE